MAVTPNKPTLAIIGTGIGGLAAAWLLKQKYQVTVFEQHKRPGMGIYTVDYDSNGVSNRIDIPLRIFTDGYYPNLLALYKMVGIKIESTNHSAAFANQNHQLFFQYGKVAPPFSALPRSIAYPKGRSLISVKAWKIALASQRFFANAAKHLKKHDLSQITLGEYLEQYQYNADFINGVLLPILSTICTCDYDSVLSYPADLILGYLTCGVMKQGVVRAEKGVDDIVPRLLEGCKVINDAKITKVQPDGAGIAISNANGETQHFDQLVIATQAQQAAELLGEYPAIQTLLQTVKFERSSMAVHTDADILPEHVVPLSPVSYLIDPEQQRPCCTVDLTKAIEGFKPQESVFQTWHPEGSTAYPHPNKLIAQVEFTRPVVTLESRQAISQLREQQQDTDNTIWLCGSYMAESIPLLDAAVDSAMAVAQSLGVSIPWQAR